MTSEVILFSWSTLGKQKQFKGPWIDLVQFWSLTKSFGIFEIEAYGGIFSFITFTILALEKTEDNLEYLERKFWPRKLSFTLFFFVISR